MIGPHKDKNKTKQLQDQGKINLSLTEMAQFFMKMAQTIKEKVEKANLFLAATVISCANI